MLISHVPLHVFLASCSIAGKFVRAPRIGTIPSNLAVLFLDMAPKVRAEGKPPPTAWLFACVPGPVPVEMGSVVLVSNQKAAGDNTYDRSFCVEKVAGHSGQWSGSGSGVFSAPGGSSTICGGVVFGCSSSSTCSSCPAGSTALVSPQSYGGRGPSFPEIQLGST